MKVGKMKVSRQRSNTNPRWFPSARICVCHDCLIACPARMVQWLLMRPRRQYSRRTPLQKAITVDDRWKSGAVSLWTLLEVGGLPALNNIAILSRHCRLYRLPFTCIDHLQHFLQ